MIRLIVSHGLMWLLVLLGLIMIVSLFGCGSKVDDTSVGKLRRIECQDNYTIYDYRLDVVYADWYFKHKTVYDAWVDGKINDVIRDSLYSDLRDRRDMIYWLIQGDRRRNDNTGWEFLKVIDSL